MPYRQLRPDLIIATAELLEKRLKERFPDRGVAAVAHELVGLAREMRAGTLGGLRQSGQTASQMTRRCD